MAAKNCTGVIGNDEEFSILAGKYEDSLNFAKTLSSNCDLIIYKKGNHGSVSFVEDREINKGVFSVNPLKPTGAGDSFMGAFENRPGLAGSFLSALVIMVLSAAIIYNSIGLEHDDKRHITDDPIEREKEKSESLEDDLST